MSQNQPDEQMNKEAGKKKKHGIITYPNTIGPYTIKSTIGEGAFSIVKLAYHELLFRNFACKIVPIHMLEERKLYERFELEIRISQLMRHPGVAAITDFLKDGNNFYVFMEYCPYGNLLDYIISQNKLPEENAKGLMYQILDALNYIHKQSVSHRDLKPENIMIDTSGHIRISDFGLSRFVGENNLVKTPCGSPCYVSPECISGKEYNGLISDIWSCGVILYAMVTGMLPWTKRKMHELFRQIKMGEYRIPNYVSAQCANLIQLLLTVDPKNRITIDEAKSHTWFNIKSPADEEKYLSYTIPLSAFQSPNQQDNNKNSDEQEPNDVPYLSTKKVDIYFRPDVDYDFDYQFNEIKNIHAISDSLQQDKCESSSPYLHFDNTAKMIEDTTKDIENDQIPLTTKKVKINPNVECETETNTNSSEQSHNLGLRSGYGMRISSVSSTGQLILLNKFEYRDFPNSSISRIKSQGALPSNSIDLINNDNNNNNKDENDVKNDDNNDFEVNTNNESKPKKEIKRMEIKPTNSARLPKRFESNPT